MPKIYRVKCCKFQINRYDNYCTRNFKAQIHRDDDVGNGHALPPPPVGVVPAHCEITNAYAG